MIPEVEKLLEVLPYKIGDEVLFYRILGIVTGIMVDTESILYEITYNKEDALHKVLISELELEKFKPVGFKRG